MKAGIGAASAISGGSKLFAARASGQVIRLGFTVALARILAPEDYGLIASVQVITGLAILLQDMGLSAATLQRERISDAQIHNLFWLNLALGACVAGAGVLFAPLLAEWLHSPQSVDVIRVLLVAVLIPSASAQHRVLMQREFRFGAIALSGVLGTLAGGGCALWAANRGAGAWALVLMLVVSDLVALAVSWAVARYRPGWPVRGVDMAPLLRFGGSFLMFRVLGHFAQNLHLLLLSRSMGFAAAGQFTRAHMLAAMATGYVTEPAGKVALPMLTRLAGEPTRLVHFYRQALGVMMLAAAPVGVFGVLFGGHIIQVLLGDQWGEAQQIFAILSLGLLVQPLMYSTGWLYMARGDMRGMLVWGCIGWTSILLAVLLALRFGPVAIAWAWSATQWALLVPCLYAAFRGFPLVLSTTLGDAARPLAAALVAGLATHGLTGLMALARTWLELTVAIVAFSALYCILAWTLFDQRALMRTLIENLQGRFWKKRAT